MALSAVCVRLLKTACSDFPRFAVLQEVVLTKTTLDPDSAFGFPWDPFGSQGRPGGAAGPPSRPHLPGSREAVHTQERCPARSTSPWSCY